MSDTNHELISQRTDTIVRAIASGVNDCNTLMCGGKLNIDFVSGAVRPTVRVCIEEAGQLRSENAAIRKDLEAKRFALESLLSNNGDIAAALPALKAALPNHPFLNN